MTDLETKYDASLEMWRLPKVVDKTGVSAANIWRMVKVETFPAPRKIGAQSVAWRSTEVIAWMLARPVATAQEAA